MDGFAKSQITRENVSVYYTYKDRVFRLLFKEKKRLFYLADLYKRQVRDIDLSVGRLIKIPTPHYVVFYNGQNNKKEEFTLKLSEAFEDEGDGCLELIVRVININFGYNQDLFSKSQSLYGYAYFVDQIRKNLVAMELRQAVEMAVDECIEKNILSDFLLEQKAEVIAMSIYEYNEEYVRKTLFEDGKTEGKIEGKIEGETRLATLIQILMEEGKEEELKRVIADQAYREQLYTEKCL